jgi:hypothetical protein
MPPRIDPYSNKTHKRIDAILVVITLVLMIVAFRASAQRRQNSTGQTPSAQAQTSVHK